MNTYLMFLSLAILISLMPEIWEATKIVFRRIQSSLYQFLKPRQVARAQRAWPELMDDIAAAVRSGVPLEQAVFEAANRSPQDLRRVLQGFVHQIRTGHSLHESLDNLLTQSIDSVGKRLITALKIASSAGGKDVVLTLQTLAESIRRDLQLLDELKAKQRSATTGARVSVFAPWLVIFLTSLQPTVRASYQSELGLILIFGIAVISVIAYLWMLQISRLKIGELK
ncbi:MAG: type II secretion system F family protein [Actinobacteria bacterium]|nr:type II secretion system F family protein [Actinomycetota bacterium]